MKIEILNDFIKAYKNAYDLSHDESFEGNIKACIRRLNEPFMHLSLALQNEFKELYFSLQKNINVAIIGQFSSGKSSLLNLILKGEFLPTGVVPVTFKPTFLHYAKDYFLRVEFEDGSDIITDIKELAYYTDQRKSIKEARSLHIFAPIPLLKKITLIDTPGLNANEIDTLTTFKEINNIHALIWLSLIDNAGKKSEEEAIKLNLQFLGEESICVLNQKDKLNQEELENVLNYAKGVFLKYFKQLIAISCKEAKNPDSYDKSNFNALLNFLTNLDENKLKYRFTKKRMLELCSVIENENQLFEDIFTNLETRFDNFEKYFDSNFGNFLKNIDVLNHRILVQLKSISEKISTEIFNSIKEKESSFYKLAKGLFKKNLYTKYNYQAPFISSDDVYLAMFYNSDIMSKEFKKIKNEIKNSFQDIKTQLSYFVDLFIKDILLFKAQYSNIQKDNEWQSDINFSEFRAFCNASDEYFLKDFKECLFKSLLELDLFFEKLNLKVFTNYENATKLSLAFFSQKINESRVLYELDSSEFPLFYPKKSEIYERVLNELSVYEFEQILIDKPFMNKIVKAFLADSKNLILQKKSLISDKKLEIQKRQKQIIDIKASLQEL